MLFILYSDKHYRKRMLLLAQHGHVGVGTSPRHLRLFCLIVFCQRPPSLMFSCTALHSWQCFSCDLKPFGLRNDAVLYVVWKLMLRSGNDLKCVHPCFVFLFCDFFSLTSAIWFLAGTFILVFWHLTHCFHPHFLFRWAFSVTWHEPEWQLECAQENSPSREIAVPHPWVLAASAVTSLPWEGTLSLWTILQLANKTPYLYTQHESSEESSFTAPNHWDHSKPFSVLNFNLFLIVSAQACLHKSHSFGVVSGWNENLHNHTIWLPTPALTSYKNEVKKIHPFS